MTAPLRRLPRPAPIVAIGRGSALVLVLAGAAWLSPAAAQTPSGLGGLAAAPGLAAGYIGLSVGKTSFDPVCRPGFGCDDRDTGFKLALGAQTADIWGVEVSYANLGKASGSGGEQKASGLTVSGVAGLPLGPTFSVFGKLGLTYARTRTSAVAPDVATGSENGFGLSYGLGLTYSFDPRFSLVAEYEQYRIKFAPGRDTVGLLSVGVRIRY